MKEPAESKIRHKAFRASLSLALVSLLALSLCGFLLLADTRPAVANGQTGWFSNLEVNGRPLEVVADPVDGSTFYAAYGPLYKTADNGETWNAVTGDKLFSCLAISPVDPDLLLLGSAQNNGSIWRYRASNDTLEKAGDNFGAVIDIAIGSGGNYPVYAITGAGVPFGDRVVRSAADIIKWSEWNGGIPADAELTTIAMSNSQQDVAFLGTWDSGIFKLDNPTVAWRLSSNGFSGMSGYPAAQHIGVEPTQGDVVLVGTNGVGIFRSEDGGANWQEKHDGIQYDTPAANGFAFDPGGCGLVYSPVWPLGVYVSDNLGVNWEQVPKAGLYTQDGGNYEVDRIALSCDLSSLQVGVWLPDTWNPYQTHGAVYSLEFTKFYFAEGYTGPGFDEWLCMANFNGEPVNAAVQYIYGEQAPTWELYTIAANSRYTVDVNSEAAVAGDVSMRVISDLPVTAERPMYFDYQGKWTGGHDVMGVNAPMKTWYFAEGYTGPSFEEWLCMANFSTVDATATVKYMYTDELPIEKQYVVPAGRRQTVDVNTESEVTDEVSMKVTSNVPIVAERPMYFDYKGMWSGGHDLMGANDTAETWYFAEGYTGPGFEEYLCMLNPGTAQTNAIVHCFFRAGNVQTSFFIEGESRRTININDLTAQMNHPGEDVAIRVSTPSGPDVIVERPMYFEYQGKWPGGHDVMGTNDTNTTWYFAEGYTGPGFNEWLCMLNQSGGNASVDVEYVFKDSPAVIKNYTVYPSSRKTLDINTECGISGDVSMKVTSDVPIVAERPMYFLYQDKWPGGHTVTGSNI